MSIDNFRDKQYNRWVGGLGQRVSKMQEYLTVDSEANGESVWYDKYEDFDLEEVSERHGKTNADDFVGFRRQMIPRRFKRSKRFDRWDKSSLADLDLPTAQAISNFHKAAAKMMDSVAINALLGTCYEKKNELIVPKEIPEDNIVPVNYVETGTAADCDLTLEKILQTQMILEQKDKWDESYADGDQLVFVASPSQKKSLLNSTKVTSADYSDVKALVEGKINKIGQFRFVWSNQLPVVNGVRSCLAYVKSQSRFGLWKNATVEMNKDITHLNELVMICLMSCGAARLDDEAFVKVLCKEK